MNKIELDEKVLFKLNNEELNLNKNNNINCNFSNGFFKQNNNITYNQNDVDGKILLNEIIISIIFILAFKFGTRNNDIYLYLLIFMAFRIFCHLKKDPIHLVYMFGYIISMNIQTPPYLDRKKYFPEHKFLEDPKNFAKIQEEVRNVLKIKNDLPLTKNTYGKQNYYIGGGDQQKDNEDGWRLLMLKSGSDITEKGQKICPFLCSLIKKIKNIKSCAVSIIPKKKAIPIHVGYYKGFIRYQLAVIIPEDRENVFICVNGEKYSWKEGEGVIFDDTYPHKVYNNTDEDRVILYIDVERSHMSNWLTYMNKTLLKLLENSSYVKDEIKRTEYQVKLD
jgi:ornithine lipid ester-linked acyl 2-hydroxylase